MGCGNQVSLSYDKMVEKAEELTALLRIACSYVDMDEVPKALKIWYEEDYKSNRTRKVLAALAKLTDEDKEVLGLK